MTAIETLPNLSLEYIRQVVSTSQTQFVLLRGELSLISSQRFEDGPRADGILFQCIAKRTAYFTTLEEQGFILTPEILTTVTKAREIITRGRS